jgi:hypothetical protein
MTAVESAHTSANVAIHVGQEVWDYLKSLAVEQSLDGLPCSTARFAGFPLILEEGARPEHISVRVTTVIA